MIKNGTFVLSRSISRYFVKHNSWQKAESQNEFLLGKSKSILRLLISDSYPKCKEAVTDGEKQDFMDTCKVDMCFDDGAASKKLQIDNFLDICSDRLVKGSN